MSQQTTESSSCSSLGEVTSASDIINHSALRLKDRPGYCGGYIVGESPTFVCNGAKLAVINNRKISLYNVKNARKVCDSNPHDDMVSLLKSAVRWLQVIGVGSYRYSKGTSILLSATSSGILTISTLYDDDEEPFLAVGRVKIECSALLSFKVSSVNGSIALIYKDDATSADTCVATVTLDYDALLANECSDVISATIFSDGEYTGYITSFQLLCILSTKVHAFAATVDLAAVAIAMGKAAMILYIKDRKMVAIACHSKISSMAFKDADTIAIGDFMGRIAVYTLYKGPEKKNVSEYTAIVCAMDMLPFVLDVEALRMVIKSHTRVALTSNVNRQEALNSGIFKGAKGQHLQIMTYHWHAHAVNCLSFNRDGTVLLSGGEEGVLVMWHLKSGNKKFVTRLGSPIFHLLAPNVSSACYAVACEANEIYFIDPFALCINNRIVGVTVPLCIGMRSLANITSTEASNVDINKAHISSILTNEYRVPHLHSWPASLKSLANATPLDDLQVGNVAICCRPNVLQVYNYMRDLQSGSLDLKNANEVSRQDEEFGHDWILDEMLINQQGTMLVTVQSRLLLYNQDYKLTGTDYDENQKVHEQNNALSTLEHILHQDEHKSILKVWIKNGDGNIVSNGVANFLVHTRVSNPHANKVTCIQQLGTEYTFVTTSLDSEFKVWKLLHKVILQSDVSFSAYNCQKSAIVVDAPKGSFTDAYTWDYVAVASYKNMPIYSISVAFGGSLIAVDHDETITFWTFTKSAIAEEVKLRNVHVCRVPPKDGQVESILPRLILPRRLHTSKVTLLYPKESMLVLYQNAKRLLLLNYETNRLVWEYNLQPQETIDVCLYSLLLPSTLFVCSSNVNESTGECKGKVEVLYFYPDYAETTCLFTQTRQVSTTVLNACLVVHALPLMDKVSSTQLGDNNIQDVLRLDLVLLTSNFDLEKIHVYSLLNKHIQPSIEAMHLLNQALETAETTPSSRKRQLGPCPQQSVLEWLQAMQELNYKHRRKIKRPKFNLAEQYCKASEYKHRLANPIPKNILEAIVSSSCPTSALPPPNVALQRLINLLMCRH